MIYVAIGDIHGCLDQLKALWDKVDLYLKEFHPGIRAKIVFLGDYVDRGPDSKGVVQYLIDLKKQNDYDFIFLKGNHEDMLLSKYESFIHYGLETLKSYDVDLDKYVKDEISNWMPREHLDFYNNLTLYYKDDDAHLFFCHGGINQDTDLDNQNEETLLWARVRGDYDKLGKWKVVHGHIPSNFEMLNHRINLDTACVFGGALTAIILDTNAKTWLLCSVDGLKKER